MDKIEQISAPGKENLEEMEKHFRKLLIGHWILIGQKYTGITLTDNTFFVYMAGNQV